MSTRITISMNQKVEEALAELVFHHETYAFRQNTIVNAAIIAFLDLSQENREKYLKRVRLLDGRNYYNKKHK